MTLTDQCQIVHPRSREARRLWEGDFPRQRHWCYLGGNTADLASLEERGAGKGIYHPANRAVQCWAKKTQRDYLSYIARLGGANPSLAWWASPLAEKNPEKSAVFLKVCYVLAAQTLLSEFSGDWVIFVESDSVAQALAAGLGVEPRRAPLGFRVRHLLAGGARLLYHRLRFLAAFVKDSVFCRVFMGPVFHGGARLALSSGKPLALLITWVDSRSFSPTGDFRDSFFPGLTRWLRTAGRTVLVVPRVAPGASSAGLWRQMWRSAEGFLPLPSFLRLSDVLRRLIDDAAALPWRKQDLPPFHGVPMSGLVWEDCWRQGLYPHVAINLLFNNVVRGWHGRGLRLERVIYPFENHGWEKVMCAALRVFYPDAVTVASLPSRLPELLPNYYNAPEEPVPFPDFVVGNGSASRRRFLEMGYDPARTLQGSALRYQHLFRRDNLARPAPPSGTILVVMPTGKTEGTELLRRMAQAARGNPRWEVWVKCHPDTAWERLVRGAGLRPETDRFHVTEEPVETLLKKHSLLVYTSTTVSVEALAFGTRLVHYVPLSNLDGDPLAGHPGFAQECATAEELQAGVERALAGESPRAVDEAAHRVLMDMFGCDGEPEAYRPFLAERPRP